MTGQTIKAVTTNEIYKGSVAFIVLQLIMVAVILVFPSLVVGNMSKDKGSRDAAVMEQLQMPDAEPMDDAAAPAGTEPAADSDTPALEAPPAPAQQDDPMKAMQDALTEKAKKAKP